MDTICRLVSEAIDPATELAEFTRQASGCGAIASFTGIARPRSKQGDAVAKILLESHPQLTLTSIEEIAEQVRRRFDVTLLEVVHRHGSISPGEAIVFVAAASDHRRAAFEAADCLMDRLKTEAVFWKREDTANGKKWIEPTADDYKAQAQWDQ